MARRAAETAGGETLDVGLIAAEGCEEAVATAFADALCSGIAGPWDELVLSAMNGESALTPLLERALSQKDPLVTVEETSASPYIAL
jgi:hypothetical protein